MTSSNHRLDQFSQVWRTTDRLIDELSLESVGLLLVRGRCSPGPVMIGKGRPCPRQGLDPSPLPCRCA